MFCCNFPSGTCYISVIFHSYHLNVMLHRLESYKYISAMAKTQLKQIACLMKFQFRFRHDILCSYKLRNYQVL